MMGRYSFITTTLYYFVSMGVILNTTHANLVDPANFTVTHFNCGFDEASGLQPDNPSIDCGAFSGAQLWFNPSGALLRTDGSGNLVITPGAQASAPDKHFTRTHGGAWPGINQAALSAGTAIAVFEIVFTYEAGSSPSSVLHPRGSFFVMDMSTSRISDPVEVDKQTGSIFFGTGSSQAWSSGRINDFAPGNWVFRGEQSNVSFTDGVKATARILIDPNQDGPNGSSTMLRLFEVNPDIDGSGVWTEIVPVGPLATRIRSQDRVTGCCGEGAIPSGPPGGDHLHLQITNHDNEVGGANMLVDRLRVYEISHLGSGPPPTPTPTATPTPMPTPTPPPARFDYSTMITDNSGLGRSHLMGVHDVKDFGAVADCQFIINATISAGSHILSSGSNPFVAEDVGKSIVVGNAGGSSANLVTTIAAFTDSGHVVLSDAASTNANSTMVQWGTDNTLAINNAIAGLTAGGTVWLGPGYYLVDSINLTDADSVNFVGAGWGNNAPNRGTVLVPMTGNYPVLDLTASGGTKIENLKIGTTRSPVTGRVGILLAPAAGNNWAHLITLGHVFITGSWSSSALYVYGVGDSSIWDCNFWNFVDSKYPMYFGCDNIDNVASRYQTIVTGSVLCGNWHISKFEAHNFRAHGPSTGSAIRMRGAGVMNFEAGLIDSSSVNGNISAEVSSNGTPCFRHVYTMCNFYTEGDTKPVHSINVPSGTYDRVTFINPSFTTSGAAVSGSITYEGFSTP